MFEEKKSGSGKIIIAVCVVAALAAVAVGAKFIIDHVNGPVDAKSACKNKDGMDSLNDAGVFGDSENNCEEEAEE